MKEEYKWKYWAISIHCQWKIVCTIGEQFLGKNEIVLGCYTTRKWVFLECGIDIS